MLIATYKTRGEALAVSKGLDRDRAVDESGNQVAVFGRRGARPFTFEEMQRMFRTQGGAGEFFTVTDAPSTKACQPCDGKSATSAKDSTRASTRVSALMLDAREASLSRLAKLKAKPLALTATISSIGLFLILIGWRRRSRHLRR